MRRSAGRIASVVAAAPAAVVPFSNRVTSVI